MSINFSLNFTRRRWAMPNIPGMPAGLWVAGKDDEGDASGGLWTAQHIFQNISNGLGDSNYYNLEQIMVNSTIPSINLLAELEIRGMDPGTENAPNLQPIPQVWAIRMFADGNSNSAIGIHEGLDRPIWIGTFRGFDTEFGDIIVRLPNPGAAEEIGVKLQGYWWTPDAINAPGGMRRPPGAIYGGN